MNQQVCIAVKDVMVMLKKSLSVFKK